MERRGKLMNTKLTGVGEQRSKHSLQKTPVSMLWDGDVETLVRGYAMCRRWSRRSEWCLKLVGSGVYGEDVRHLLQWLGGGGQRESSEDGARVSGRASLDTSYKVEQGLGYTWVVGGTSGGRWDDTRFPNRERYQSPLLTVSRGL